ncbi:MAG: hypothetical protein KDI49_08360 [Gammaproteobacteria bacterium]|nr:hypothetical protein [Gammaproteobacteria bacterium]MCP5443362.1 hypothetical protein [Chromatiaceae bacterium]
MNQDLEKALAAEILILLGEEREGLNSQSIFERSGLSEDQAEMRKVLHDMVNRKLLTRDKVKSGWIYIRSSNKSKCRISNRYGILAGSLSIVLRHLRTVESIQRRVDDIDPKLSASLNEGKMQIERAFEIAKNISRRKKPSVGSR